MGLLNLLLQRLTALHPVTHRWQAADAAMSPPAWVHKCCYVGHQTDGHCFLTIPRQGFLRNRLCSPRPDRRVVPTGPASPIRRVSTFREGRDWRLAGAHFRVGRDTGPNQYAVQINSRILAECNVARDLPGIWCSPREGLHQIFCLLERGFRRQRKFVRVDRGFDQGRARRGQCLAQDGSASRSARQVAQLSPKQLIQKVEFLCPSHEKVCCSMGSILTFRAF